MRAHIPTDKLGDVTLSLSPRLAPMPPQFAVAWERATIRRSARGKSHALVVNELRVFFHHVRYRFAATIPVKLMNGRPVKAVNALPSCSKLYGWVSRAARF